MPYTIEIFYATCAIVGLIFTLFSAIISHSGHGHFKIAKFKLGKLGKLGRLGKIRASHQPHSSSSTDANQLNPQFTPLSVINPLTFATFLGLFGLLGLLATLELKMSVTTSLIFSSLISSVISVGFSWVITKILSQSQSSSVTNAREAIGIRAKVITKIEKGRLGSISYIDKGTILTLPACSLEEETIERGDEVYIARTDGKMAYVKREREGLWR